MAPESLLRLPEVLNRTGLSRTHLFLLIRQKRFPAQIPLTEGGKCSAWIESEVSAWIAARIESARKTSAA